MKLRSGNVFPVVDDIKSLSENFDIQSRSLNETGEMRPVSVLVQTQSGIHELYVVDGTRIESKEMIAFGGKEIADYNQVNIVAAKEPPFKGILGVVLIVQEEISQ